MKHMPGIFFFPIPGAIDNVPGYRPSHMGKMDSDLMGSPSLQFYLHKSMAAKIAEDPKICD